VTDIISVKPGEEGYRNATTTKRSNQVLQAEGVVILKARKSGNSHVQHSNDPNKKPSCGPWAAIIRNRRLIVAGFALLVMGVLAAPLAAQETAPIDGPGGIRQLGDVLELKAKALSRELKNEASRLTEQLTGTEVKTYPYRDRPFARAQSYHFERDVRPIIDKKCVACHSCYEAPCQLNLAHPQGLERGASKTPVYDGFRLRDSAPTRLHIDAQTTAAWRNKGFFSVLDATEPAIGGASGSLLLKFLELGRSRPLAADKPVRDQVELGLARTNSCPAPGQFADHAAENVHGGMPLAVTGLSDGEYQVVSTWLREGARIDAMLPQLSAPEAAFLGQAEAWLNRPDDRAQLVARYIYEHLFMAHLYLEKPAPGKPPRFFQMIRSSTPPGQPVVPLATVRPNDPPNGPFYYRIFPVSDRIVHKTHITYRFDAARLAFYDQLFLQPGWSVSEMPDYSEAFRSNPFITFKAIPAKARYQFLLEDAEFVVRNFIRGPVCNGEVATYVIRDQFWVMFADPSFEHYVNDPAYQSRVNDLLGVPGQKTALSQLGPEWVRYQEQRNAYQNSRQQAYNSRFPQGPRLQHIWRGNGSNENAFLTVFRHHTNASVTQGWRGEYPLTAWLMDYPLIERTFYELVVGFDVFANVSHQVQARLYFDLIRNEGETNFLGLLPPASRQAIYDDWYQADAKIKAQVIYNKLDTTSPGIIPDTSPRPKEEFFATLMSEQPALTQSTDLINRCDGACADNERQSVSARINGALRLLAARQARAVSGIRWLPEVSFLRINLPDGRFLAYSILRNRRHSNVAFIFGESLRRQEDLDSLTILPELIGSYPNMIFQVDLNDLEIFSNALASVNSDNAFDTVLSRWGVLRMAPDFWDVFHSFTDHVSRTNPLEAGIYDMNRYGTW